MERDSAGLCVGILAEREKEREGRMVERERRKESRRVERLGCRVLLCACVWMEVNGGFVERFLKERRKCGYK